MKLGVTVYREQKVISFSENLFDKIEDYLIQERDSDGDGEAYDKLEQTVAELVRIIDEISGDKTEFELSVDVKSVRRSEVPAT